jgi:hypothetical protein
MSQITLSDYVGFIFSEIVKARVLADAESKRIALLYKDDEILKNFSVPRFKIPEMNLSIPVLISGARYKTTLRFNLEETKFNEFIINKLNNVVTTIRIADRGIISNFETANEPVFVGLTPTEKPVLAVRQAARKTKASAKQSLAIAQPVQAMIPIDETMSEFYKQLTLNPDPAAPENIVQIRWAQLFNTKMQETRLLETYRRLYPNGELYISSYKEVLAFVKANTVVEKSQIENILVNPETQTVKEGSNADSVFIVNAKIVEDGLFIKEIKDSEGNVTDRVVEFD